MDADLDAINGRELPSAQIPLSRERIVQTAISYISDHGLASLSMRRLATTLGVEAMSLYRYVVSRDDLLDAIVEDLVEEMDSYPDVITAPDHGWQDFLQRLAHGVRKVALAHPAAFPLIASRPAEAPWLRPPLRSLRWVEFFLNGLEQEGFSNQAAAAAYRAFTSFLLGHLLLEVASHGADLGPLDVIDDDHNDSLDAYPTVERLSPLLREDHSAAEFEESLENLLDRIALIKSEN
ncbi:TetR/AcrR family transcriptional regulator [Naumannella halotolerans]|uniref:TetR/AcrR family transcriptional regulator n=1 Tax=Naumannella halotolerans TaxID=993414 RepID=UPI001AB007B4|nr:TetR/AcrR family transcriptional regulator C-terminal domain-containing protein [Naumannella halotolerans]